MNDVNYQFFFLLSISITCVSFVFCRSSRKWLLLFYKFFLYCSVKVKRQPALHNKHIRKQYGIQTRTNIFFLFLSKKILSFFCQKIPPFIRLMASQGWRGKKEIFQTKSFLDDTLEVDDKTSIRSNISYFSFRFFFNVPSAISSPS